MWKGSETGPLCSTGRKYRHLGRPKYILGDMSAILRPEKAIVPIVRATKARPIIAVLGTGFFVGNEAGLHVITAKHVIDKNPLKDEEKYAIVFYEKSGIKVVAISQVLASTEFDLAVCKVSTLHLPEIMPMMIGRAEPSLNQDVFSYEYSSTRIESTPTGGTNVSFEPYFHKGNIVRSFTSTYPETIDTTSYLVSFPAMQGASGAPVFTGTSSKKNFAVVGMIVANIERELIPAQLVEIHDGASYQEKTTYYLPYGKALAGSVIARCLEEMGIPFVYAEDSEESVI